MDFNLLYGLEVILSLSIGYPVMRILQEIQGKQNDMQWKQNQVI